jgi:hypothetical protein
LHEFYKHCCAFGWCCRLEDLLLSPAIRKKNREILDDKEKVKKKKQKQKKKKKKKKKNRKGM